MDAKAYKAWPGLGFNSCAYHGPAPWRGGRYAIVFDNGCNTHYLRDASMEELLAYGFRPWGQQGAPCTTSTRLNTSEYAAIYVRIPPSIRPYTCQYTDVYWRSTFNCLHKILHAVPLLHALVRTVLLDNRPTYAKNMFL